MFRRGGTLGFQMRPYGDKKEMPFFLAIGDDDLDNDWTCHLR